MHYKSKCIKIIKELNNILPVTNSCYKYCDEGSFINGYVVFFQLDVAIKWAKTWEEMYNYLQHYISYFTEMGV